MSATEPARSEWHLVAAKVLLTMKAGKALAKRLKLKYPETTQKIIAFVRRLDGNQDLPDELRFDLRENFRSSGKNQYEKGKAAKLGEKLQRNNRAGRPIWF